MGDLSKNFSRAEFSCRCGCGFDTIDAELINILQRMRDHLGMAVEISGPNRCEAHNKAEGGAPSSQHIHGRAADVKVKGLTGEELYRMLDLWYPNKLGLGMYSNRVHIDTRTGVKARW